MNKEYLQGDRTVEVSTSLEAFTTVTRAHADEFNRRLQVLLDNDTALEAGTTQEIKDLRSNLLDLALETQLLKKATLTGVDSNMIIEAFTSDSDILFEGYYDEKDQKLTLR